MRYETRQFARLRVGGFLRLAAVGMVMFLALMFSIPSVTAAPTSNCLPGGDAAKCALEGLNTTSSTAGLGTVDPTNPQGQERIATIVGTIIYSALAISGVIFLVLIVYGGFRWMTAQGSSEEIEKAKEIIRSAIIGIVILGLAFAITNFVINAVAVANVTSP